MRFSRPLPLILAAALITAPALAEPPAVVADIAPVHSLVALVMGERGTPVLLMDAGANPHDFQMRPSQARALAGADLVVRVGPEMTPWLDRALAGTGAQGHVLGLLAAEGTLRRDYGAAHGDHDHGHGHDHEHVHADDHDHDDHAHDHDHHDHHGHSHEGTDPHAWLDPANGRHWLGLIAEDLARLDPEGARDYRENAARAAARIAILDAEIAARLEPLHDKPFVVFHDAYGYFTEHYGLVPAVAIAAGDASAPGAARLQAVQAEIRDSGARCIFPEAGHDPRLAETVAGGTGANMGPALDPEGTAQEPGPGLYEALLMQLADNLAACLGD